MDEFACDAVTAEGQIAPIRLIGEGHHYIQLPRKVFPGAIASRSQAGTQGAPDSAGTSPTPVRNEHFASRSGQHRGKPRAIAIHKARCSLP